MRLLNISDNNISSEGYHDLNELLRQSSALQVLHVQGNRADGQVLRKMASSLEQNVRLKLVSLKIGLVEAEET